MFLFNTLSRLSFSFRNMSLRMLIIPFRTSRFQTSLGEDAPRTPPNSRLWREVSSPPTLPPPLPELKVRSAVPVNFLYKIGKAQ